ncbi:DUF397 domain-containing protein [Herbidospora sp. NBRC 101105]|uniref:DUF397 domain-containing protein n=1 Tax=Herbidospora sp. NBRC 101105 TaxID=3032195 RepID=UPI0024A4AEFD|nr:DUF397 domain-containing protein [Herbidospora sp. NBRC 101105]GLX93936.1 hypothetical protein Hesp01_18860 [Herbidospora sp. NBRC 101105]
MNKRKSSFSGPVGECVEVEVVSVIKVRDTKDPQGPALSFTPGEWRAFCAGVRGGEFDVRAAGFVRPAWSRYPWIRRNS